MDRYLNYLLADIAAATGNVPVLAFEDPDEEEPFISMEEEEQTARREVLAKWIGVQQEWFPPAHRLEEQQMAALLDALSDCLDAYGFIPNFPIGLPLRSKYEVLISFLAKEVPILAYNSYQIDFCEYEPGKCPFGDGYCQCKVYERWISRFEESAGNEETALEETGVQGFLDEENFGIDEDMDEGFFFEGDFSFEEGFEEEEWEEDEEDDFFSGFDFDPDDDGCWN